MANILVVDDELGIRDLLSEILNDEGHTVEAAENAEQARQSRLGASPDLVLLDVWMPETDGVTLLKEWANDGLLTMPVIMMSGHATIDTAVAATKIGAHSFLEKPITLQKLLAAVNLGLEGGPLESENELEQHDNFFGANGYLGPVPPSNATQEFQLDKPLRVARDAFEKAYFEYHLARERGSITRVAVKADLERSHLYRKLKHLGIDVSRGKRNHDSGH